MPIFEYLCRDCGRKFEALVIGSQKPECPGCHSQQLDQQLSTFSARATAGTGTAPAMAPCGAPAGACSGCGIK